MHYGEIIELGRHKLMCGDATKREDVMKLIGDATIELVLTDPPYGNRKIQKKHGAIGGLKGSKRIKHGAGKFPLMLGNESTRAARLNYDIIKGLTKNIVIFGGHYFSEFLPPSPGWIFWDKRISGDFGAGEFIWSSLGTKIEKIEFLWNGCYRRGTYKLNPKPRVHPTQKPVEVLELVMDMYGGRTVLDCFGGSGSTLIACEHSGRTCYIMERAEKYCEDIKERFLSFTGMA